jgi:hypothetical protein
MVPHKHPTDRGKIGPGNFCRQGNYIMDYGIFLFATMIRVTTGSTQPIQWVPGGSIPGDKMLRTVSQPLTSIYCPESVEYNHHAREKFTVTKLFQCYADLQ